MKANPSDSTPSIPASRLMRALEEAASKLEALQAARFEPIAVVGIGLRFPGDATDPDAFWHLLSEGVDAMGEIPNDRFDVDGRYDPNPDAADKIYVRQGGFLAECAAFDARFFEIAPREAASMDPQQRLLLEVAWETLENAGIAPADLAGSPTGVFVGITTNDYGGLLLRSSPSRIDAYYGTGNALNAMPGRLAHILGLQGPALAVDTACSSSLVAVHLACQSLRARECDLALAGGVNLILAPEPTVALCRARMLAPDGRCKTFDAAADGYGRGEGCGVVALKRLSDAQAAGDPVLALIRGSAVNQDGATSGFTVPNGRAQEALICRALENAQVAPHEVDYLEAHGTGTALGDPIEVQAAARALGRGREAGRPLILGSVKTNIGHLEAAAGIAGLIKTVLALSHRTIPKHLHFQTPNPHIPWQDLPVEVAAETRAWPSRPHRRTAGVSSFGASGTNVHVIVQEAPEPRPEPSNPVERPLHLLALSAKTPAALAELARRYAEHLDRHPEARWADICHSANVGRSHFGVRASVVAETSDQARVRLSALADGQGGKTAADAPKLAFLFSGQGSQYAGMGRQLYATQPTFRRALDRCQNILRDHLDRPLLDILHGPDGAALDDTTYTQPALFALQYALSELWKSFSVTPDAVLGHSVGEYAAACVAGVFSLEDGLWLIAQRARLMGRLPAIGGMAAVYAEAERVTEVIAPYADELSIAAINGPAQTVISGTLGALDEALARFEAAGLRTARLKVSHAFHSPLTEPLLAEFAQIAEQIRYRAPDVAFISNLTGAEVRQEAADPAYWVRHAREPVRFKDGIDALLRRKCGTFVEIGPARTLLGMVRAWVPEDMAAGLPSLHQEGDDWRQMLQSLGHLYESGWSIDWRGFDRDYARVRLALPTYPWQRQRYWAPTTINAIRLDNVAAALDRLKRSGRFSEDELRLAPRLLEALSGSEDEAGEARLYSLAWRDRYLPVPPEGLASPRALGEGLRPVLARRKFTPEDERYRQVLDQIESLCVQYVTEAWRRLGWVFQPGERGTVDELARRLGVADRHRRLFERTAEILDEAGVLCRDGDTFTVVTTPEATDPSEAIGMLLAQCPAAVAELSILDRCGLALAQVLKGELDPLTLLFPAGDVTSAASLYRDAPGARRLNGLLRDVLARALERLPANRRLRVLEIGAGTGGTTGDLLAVLPPDRTDYLFTDISPRFTTAAKETFRAYPFLRFQVLDIERDPAKQGFAGQSFDLIVAANVLHATRNIAETLAHVRSLAAPGALLLLLEGTAPIRFIDLIFGLTEGWWRFAGDPARPSHPLLSAARWQSLLLEAGYAEADALAFPEDPWGVVAKQAVILARAPAAPASAKRWLILADRSGIGKALAARLEAEGDVTVLACAAAGFARLGERSFQVSPRSEEDYRRLAEAMDVNFELVDLWSLDDTAATDQDAETLARHCENRLGAVAQRVRALADDPRLRRLWFVTRGAVATEPAGDQALAPGQAALWGLCRVLAREHPELKPMCIDLDPGMPAAEQIGSLIDELRDNSFEVEIAIRASGRQAPRLVPYQPPKGLPPLRFRADASYLITGGFGGLGLAVARWMTARGARHLALVGRSGESERAAAARRDIEGQGAVVKGYRADVADTEQVAHLLADIKATMPPLAGVIHAAGVLDDAPLRQLDEERFARVLAPKLAGAWNLHRLTRDKNLDCFVLFSSFTALAGSPGQANHAAANAFLDALAHLRRAEGLPAVSIGWGPWAEIGAVAERQIGERIKLSGATPIAPAVGLRLLEQAWRAGPPQLAALAMDWARFAEKLGAAPLFAELLPASPEPAAKPAAAILERLRDAPAHTRRGLLIEYVCTELAAVLGLEGGESIDPLSGFFQLGMDSLTAMELRNRLGAGLGRSLPMTVAFDYPTPAALADFLDGELHGTKPPAVEMAGPESAVGAGEAARLEELSQEEIETLLDAELEIALGQAATAGPRR